MIVIRNCEKSDLKDIIDICYRTGYLGEDLTGQNKFNDKILFGYLFCYYYPKYENENCFVAVDQTKNSVIGYILGTLDTKKQRKKLFLKMSWRIALRIICVTLWKYPETIRSLFRFVKSIDIEQNIELIYKKYPAHLHINILSDYQRMGIGEKLLFAFESNIKKYSIGIHLITTDKNSKAIPFYNKMGYKVIQEKQGNMWNSAKDSNSIVFAKEFC